MASTAASSGSFASNPIGKLKTEPDALRREAESSAEFERVQEEAKLRRLQALLAEQNSQPMTINRLQVHGATNTRRGFLDPIFKPLLTADINSSSTLGEVAARLGDARGKLERLGIFHPDPKVHLSNANNTDPSSTPTDVDVDVVVKELSRYKFNLGTDVGNNEGSASTSLLWRNIFGGAEQLNVNASTGTRTRSAYSATLSAPVQSNPDTRISLEGLASATDKSWAAHEEVLKGGNLRFLWHTSPQDVHSVEYSGIWRQVTGLRDDASPTVRADAGDSVKSSFKHIYQRDLRDNPQLPQSGYMLRSAFELAGVGPLGGDVAFSKNELEVGGAVPVPLPGVQGPSGVSIGGGFRFGMLYPLPLGFSSGQAQPSRINDRFQLGGPTDVRGFHYGGLGPHDGQDAVGGDVFAAGSVNMLFPLPYKGPDSSLRFQVFANSGRLVALKNKSKTPGESLDASGVARSMLGALNDLGTGLPSTAVGLGLVYAHPVARFELNFSLPLVLRRGEQGTKGFQVGVGINFL
ncbi:SAM50-like protein [Colletotrichum sidae]|uniref:SAM50-like protein n=1 Tax=Colletotrichum sidae TaxID=1347389 RepID=A0A4R8TG06_9PEZI|nr:SAM50-like protein [Colletotrichum sidae]